MTSRFGVYCSLLKTFLFHISLVLLTLHACLVDASSGGAGVAGSIPVSITNAEASSFNFDILDQTMSKSRNQSSKGTTKPNSWQGKLKVL